MQVPTVSQALAAWERGMDRGAVERSLALLAMARPQTSPEDLADIALGERDGTLLELREAMFGPEVNGHFACTVCGEHQEITLHLGDLKSRQRAPAPMSITSDGFAIELRRLTSRDLIAAAAVPHEAGRILLDRSVTSASCDGRPVQPHALPAPVIDAVARAMAEADPDADISLAVTCSNCGHSTRMAFDIGAYLWEEVDAWADRTLRDVHLLAASYGWSERDILDLSPARRRRYLELAGT